MAALFHTSTTPIGSAAQPAAVARAIKADRRAMSCGEPAYLQLAGNRTSGNDIDALLARYPL